jgi:hypothetical protein
MMKINIMKFNNLDKNYNHEMTCYCFMKISLTVVALFKTL